MLGLKKATLQFCIALFLSLMLLTLSGSSQAVAGGDRISQKIKALNDENRLLEVESAMASTGMPYIILELRTEADFVVGRIYLKNRGILLREFDAERIRCRRTKSLVTEPVPLLKKTAFPPAGRKEIKPHKTANGTETKDDLDFLESKDMPLNYALSFGGGLFISITGKPKGLISQCLFLVRSILRHIRLSLMVVWNHLWNKELTIIEVRMRSEDAQCLYWSLEHGVNIVVSEGYPDRTA